MTTYLGRISTTGTTAGALLSLLRGKIKAVECGSTQVGIARKFQLTDVDWDSTTWLTCLIDMDDDAPITGSTGSTGLTIDGTSYTVSLEWYYDADIDP